MDNGIQRVEVHRPGTFAVGEIVTRHGTDRHRVIDVNGPDDLIEVECVVAPESGWCQVGDREWNIPGRYERSSL